MKDTSDVISCFENKIGHKPNHEFILFKIKNLYQNLTKDLLKKFLNFAEEKAQISDDNTKIIYHARKSLLFNREVFL